MFSYKLFTVYKQVRNTKYFHLRKYKFIEQTLNII